MSKADTTSEQQEQTAISSSLRLALLAAVLTTIADAIATIAALEAIDEFITADIQANQEQQELDDKLKKMQRQIDLLTYELAKIKRGMV